VSIAHQRAVFKLLIPPQEKSILGIFAFHARDRTGRAWPKLETVAEESGWSLSTIRRVVRWLDKEKLLVPVAYLNGGRGRSTEYLVNVDVTEFSTELSTTVENGPDKPGQHVSGFAEKPGQTAVKTHSRSSSRNDRESVVSKSYRDKKSKNRADHQPSTSQPTTASARARVTETASPPPSDPTHPTTNAEWSHGAQEAAKLASLFGPTDTPDRGHTVKGDPSGIETDAIREEAQD
jgi:helix-turn-helix protein